MDAAALEEVVVRVEAAGRVGATGQVVTARAATRAAALGQVAILVKTTTGQDATMEEATGRGRVRWRSWRWLGTDGKQRC